MIYTLCTSLSWRYFHGPRLNVLYVPLKVSELLVECGQARTSRQVERIQELGDLLDAVCDHFDKLSVLPVLLNQLRNV